MTCRPSSVEQSSRIRNSSGGAMDGDARNRFGQVVAVIVVRHDHRQRRCTHRDIPQPGESGTSCRPAGTCPAEAATLDVCNNERQTQGAIVLHSRRVKENRVSRQTGCGGLGFVAGAIFDNNR